MSLPRPQIKEIGLALASLLLSLILFLSVAAAAAAGFTHTVILTIVGLIAFSWLALIAVYLAFAPTRWLAYLIIFFSAFLLALIGRFHISAIIGALILIGTLVPARRAFQLDLHNHVKYQTSQAFGSGVHILLLGLIMSISGLILPQVSSLIAQKGISINAATVSWIIKPVSSYFANDLPGLADGGTVDDYLDQQFASQLPAGQTLSSAQRQLAYQEISQRFGDQPITGTETLADIVAYRLNSWLKNLTQANSITIAFSLIVLVLLTIRAILPVVAWLVLALITFLIFLSRRVGLLQLTEVPTPAQKLEIR